MNDPDPRIEQITGRRLDPLPSEITGASEPELEILSESELKQAADVQLVHAMLGELADTASEERRRRIARVMEAVRGPATPATPWRLPRLARWAAVAAVAIISVVVWQLQESPATASAALQQMIRASESPADRVYLLTTVTTSEPSKLDRFLGKPREPRKREPSMSGPISTEDLPEGGGLLYVRGASQYVLMRRLDDGGMLITGSNGSESWSVEPDRPVRVSSDPLAFQGPIPALQTRIPFFEIRTGLRQIEKSYDLQLMSPWRIPGDRSRVLQRLRADRRGDDRTQPQIIHVWYHQDSGLVQQIQMDGMSRRDYPRLTRLTVELLEQRELPADWYEHTAHHEPDRPVKQINRNKNI